MSKFDQQKRTLVALPQGIINRTLHSVVKVALWKTLDRRIVVKLIKDVAASAQRKAGRSDREGMLCQETVAIVAMILPGLD